MFGREEISLERVPGGPTDIKLPSALWGLQGESHSGSPKNSDHTFNQGNVLDSESGPGSSGGGNSGALSVENRVEWRDMKYIQTMATSQTLDASFTRLGCLSPNNQA